MGEAPPPVSDRDNDTDRPVAAFEAVAATPSQASDQTSAGIPSEGLGALVTAVRWATTTVGLLWATALGSEGLYFLLGVGLLVYCLWRTFRPIDYGRRGWRSLVSILTELAITVAIVVGSDCWDSPFIFALFTPVIAAGFARGFWHALRIAITAALAVGMAASLQQLESGIRPVISWSGELVLVAAVASYGRHLIARAEQVRALNLSQLWRLNEANALLVGLNRLAHDLPVSFDFQDTVASALTQVREVTKPDLSLLLLLDPLSTSWTVAIIEGARLPETLEESQLPAAIQPVARGREPHLSSTLSVSNPGFGEQSRCGLYLPLWAGRRQVGLLAVEAVDREHFGDLEMSLLSELAEPIALTIDNARWFERLRARGAAQERNRIARDLHDRVGQGIAYVAFELDRLCAQARETDLEDDLDQLRTDARLMVRELRETLYDLRTDVSDDQGLIATIREFLGRVSSRSSIETHLRHDETRRLPLAQEREVWRICQEAIVNAERHADADTIWVEWDLDDTGGELLISDDGIGLQAPIGRGAGGLVGYGEAASPGRPSYGLTGMRERADAIGATLEVTNNEPAGTVVRLRLGDRQSPNTSSAQTGMPSREGHH